jgi:hypothetical protein
MRGASEPLLTGGGLPSVPPPRDLTRGEVNFIFSVLGLCSSVLWNQLLLSVDLLVELFGESAISIAATSQNLLCALVMWVLTFAPASVAMKARGSASDHRARQIVLAAGAVICMLVLAAALSLSLIVRQLPVWLFVILVAADGAATGTAQIVGASLGGMLSGASSDAAGALLLGESAAPLLTALCSALVSLQPGHDAYHSTLSTLALPMVVLMLALVALRKLYVANPPGGVPLECTTLGIAGSNEEGSSFISMRVRALLPNALCVGGLCAVWIFFLCSVPAVAAGLCGPSGTQAPGAPLSHCMQSVPPLMVGISNVSAFLGRLLGGVLPPGCVPWWALVVETVGVVVIASSTVLAAEAGSFEGIGSATSFGGALSAAITLWCNVLLMRLSASAQRSAGPEHSILCPCPITAQISWVAIQSGCVGGSALSFLIRAGPSS